MKSLALPLTLILTTPTFADHVEDVRQTEIAFAKAFADGDKERFFAFIADDATFLSATTTSIGKQQVIDRWSRFFSGPDAPFLWAPDRVSVSSDGTLGLSTGPVHDPQGNHVGDYISTWRRQSDGTWKIVFDSSGPGPATLPEHAPPHEEGFLTTEDGARLYYRKIGSGPQTIIAPLDYVLHPVLRQFSDRATVITYDLRNRGKSDHVQDVNTLTIEQDVRDLESVRSHFNIEKFVPVGYSYLGKVAIMYAAAHPQRVTCVIQLAPAANRAAPTGARQVALDFGAPEADLKKLQELRASGAMEKAPREFCEAQWRVLSYYLVGDPKHASRIDIKGTCALQNEWPVNFNKHMVAHGPSIEKAVMSETEMRKVTMPVLVIHGTKDRNAPYEAGRAWATELPNARLVTIEGAAHAVMLDNPPAAFATMRQFLRGDWPMGSVD